MVDIRLLLNDIQELLGGLAYAKGIDFRVRHLKYPPYYTISDYEMLWRVLLNLVSNAIKYTPTSTIDKHSSVLIGATRTGDRFSIDVCDNGMGIPKNYLSEIWEPFFQVENHDRNREKGLGLGLSIVRAACESLGHQISFSSIEGRGSRFSIDLPICFSPPSGELKNQEIPELNRIENSCVFLLEDDKEARESLEYLLNIWDVYCVSGISTSEVINLSSKYYKEPDAIITDFNLSDKETGYNVITAIRTHYNKCIPAIIVTGDLIRSKQLLDPIPLMRLLYKPVKPARLRSTLNNLLSQATVH